MVFQNGEDGAQLGRTKKKKSLGWFLYFIFTVESSLERISLKLKLLLAEDLHSQLFKP